MNKITTKNLTLCALFAALTAVFSQLSIQIGAIPLNLATLSVFIAGGLLGWKYGALSQIVYVLLGVFGAPVFNNFTGGIGIVIGKTGGYIVGYVVAAFLVGLISNKLKKYQAIVLPVSMALGLLACYFLGTAWFMFVTGTKLWQALAWCVFPFILGDGIKILVATILVITLRKALKANKIF